MFSLSKDILDPIALTRELGNDAAGALVTFEGRVRNHNEGLAVGALDYESFEPMALKEGFAIMEEARSRFGLLETKCVHRLGHLEVGEIAIWVGVSSAHRGDAFDACRYIIDEAKKRVPIWKKENLCSGESHWVACHDSDETLPGGGS